jgi:hypothetical protein
VYQTSGNYNDDSGTVADHIAKADAHCTVTPYSATYDGGSHGIGVVCTGVDSGGSAAGSLITNTETFKDYPGGTAHWSFAGGTNYNDQSGTGAVMIAKAVANCSSITSYSVVYDGLPHGINGTCNGVDAGAAAAGSSLSLGASYTFVPGGTASWSFTGGTNYTNQSGSVTISITTAFKIVGFYQPVDMTAIGSTRFYNSVKNGQTVPLKFEVFTLGGTEITSTAGINVLYSSVACDTGIVDPALIDTVATGGTVLRYDGTSGQFIFNWTVPKGAGKCYQVTVQTVDHSTAMTLYNVGVEAYFRSK